MAGFLRRMCEGVVVSVTAWVASHTGLPSIYSADPVRVTCGDRVLADGSGPVLLSDALAEPGVPTTYTVGDSSVTLTRAAGGRSEGILTMANGRGVQGLIYADNRDTVDLGVEPSRFNARISRWAIEDPPDTGTAVFVLTDLSREDEVVSVLRQHGQVVIGPARPTVGVPMRMVTVAKPRRTRLSSAAIQFEVPWTEFRVTSGQMSGAAPVVTWGEWEAFGDALLAKWGVADGTVEVRRNRANRPAGTSAGLNPGELGFVPLWAGDGGSQQISLLTGIQGPAGTGITTAIRKKWTVIGADLQEVSFWNTLTGVSAYPITPGEVYTVSSYWRVSRSQSSMAVNRMVIVPIDASGKDLNTIYGVNNTGPIVANEWNKLSVTGTMPENAAYAAIRHSALFTDSTALQVGDTLDATGLLVEKSSVLGPYFDGSYSPDPDLTPSWTGTENASASVLKVASGWQHYSALDLCRTIAGMPA
jgi:hypothetical protein